MTKIKYRNLHRKRYSVSRRDIARHVGGTEVLQGMERLSSRIGAKQEMYFHEKVETYYEDKLGYPHNIAHKIAEQETRKRFGKRERRIIKRKYR